MNNSLEKKVLDGKNSLTEELNASMRAYPQTFKQYVKMLGPAVAISSIGSAAAQWGAVKLGYDGPAAATAAAYIGGYIPGYSYFFGMEYLKNKEKYPKGIISREFGEFAGSFLAADYVADISTFTPAFIASNVWLMKNTSLNPITRSIISWNGSALLYLGAMAALHPITKRATNTINKRIKSLMSRTFPKKDKNSTEEI